MKNTILFNVRKCLTQEALTKYARLELPDDDLKIAEQHLKECEFCSDALQGLALSVNAERIIAGMKQEIMDKTRRNRIVALKNKNKYLIISLAASVAILAGLSFFFPAGENSEKNSVVEVIGDENPEAIAAPPAPDPNKFQDRPNQKPTGNETAETRKRLMPTIAEKPEPEYLNRVFTFTDEMPEFPGGIVGLDNYIQHNIREAEDSKKVHSCGVVYVEFVVNEKGMVSQPKVVNGRNPKLDQIALELIEDLPEWKPGRQSGHLVKVSVTLPLRFDKC